MTTMFSRRAQRMLSIDRRTGSQVPPEVLAGRTQRHAQGWRDINVDRRVEPADAMWPLLAMSAAGWLLLMFCGWAAMALF